jgi:hypothetical protein
MPGTVACYNETMITVLTQNFYLTEITIYHHNANIIKKLQGEEDYFSEGPL